MITLRATFHDRSTSFRVDDLACVIPIGVATLADGITGDPPLPEDLTNVIGLVHDHLEDASREIPMFEFAERVELGGRGMPVIAAIEFGGAIGLPFHLTREAAEDVFRTLVTEHRSARQQNPGLPDTMVHEVLGVASAVVALMRFLSLEAVWLVAE